MRKISLVAAATVLVLTAVGAWAVSTTYARVEAPSAARIDPLQGMMNAKDLPVTHYDDYSLVFN